MEILTVINSLRESDKYIKTIFSEGGCYQFHLFLKALFPECKPMINEEPDHVITEYKGKYYDIQGELRAIDFEESDFSWSLLFFIFAPSIVDRGT